jgi:hypothetical protein
MPKQLTVNLNREGGEEEEEEEEEGAREATEVAGESARPISRVCTEYTALRTLAGGSHPSTAVFGTPRVAAHFPRSLAAQPEASN